jgi:uncharacterized protein (TIGR02145 family)
MKMKSFVSILNIVFFSMGFLFSQTIMNIHTTDGQKHEYDLFDVDSITFDILGETGSVTDIDGNTYRTVKIGNQWWMAENLKVTHYRNGDPIDNITDNSEWASASSGAYCVYSNEASNKDTYGLLYNWLTVDDSRNIAPEGWHVPSDEEWKELEMYLGMSQSEADAGAQWRGTDEGGKLKETGTVETADGLWYSPNTGATNEVGFSAVPSGIRHWDDGTFQNLGISVHYWTSTSGAYPWRRQLMNDYETIWRNYCDGHYGYSIRCVKDE